MDTTNDKYTDLAIIGNGFDMAHGYKTSYRNFAKAVGEDVFSEYKFFLDLYCGNNDDWNSFEKKVEELAVKFYERDIYNQDIDENEMKQFNTVFSDIKNKLAEYLHKETTGKKIREISSVKIY